MEKIANILEIDYDEFKLLNKLYIIQQLINLDGDDYSDGEVIDFIQEVINFKD